MAEKGIRTKGTAKELRTIAEDNDLLTKETSAKVIEGWEEKPKGLLQVLWERGWIDDSNLQQYTLKGKEDIFGVLRRETSLKALMSDCEDFKDEESLLQSMEQKMGISVDRTPKCHCELAGEGIEYSWGCAKNFYRTIELTKKKGKEKFRAAVSRCLSREVLTTERMRKFARRARQYICAYYKIHHDEQAAKEANTELTDTGAATPIKLEKLVKEFKTHRCAMDFDTKFCKVVFKESVSQ